MNAAEALTRLIEVADKHVAFLTNLNPTGVPKDTQSRIDDIVTSVAITQAMLNMMLPIARFRVHVEIDDVQGKRTPGQQKLAAYSEFTACSTKMDGIKSSLLALTTVDTNVRITVFEQRATGADMLTAYQGRTRVKNFKIFLDQLTGLEAAPVLN